jgi:2-iminoacetate synthase ThiH
VEIEAYIKAKIADYKKTLEIADDDIPPCSAEERWEKPTKYAVKKNGNKKAYKLLETLEEAERIAGNMGKEYSIETRLGESTRCSEYCSCCDFCNFYRDNVAVAEEGQETAA